MKLLSLTLIALISTATGWAQLTLEQCQRLARDNYPLIAQYALVEQTTNYNVSNARRAYLPQLSATAHATYQSDVAEFPEQMQTMFSQMDIKMVGLNKDQYRAMLELNQNIWDGGTSQSQRKAAEADGAIQKQSLEVEMYALRARITDIFFGILLLDEQLRSNKTLQQLLQSNRTLVAAHLKNGVATQSDLNAVEVELLTARQQQVSIETSAQAYRQILSLFTGRKTDTNEPLEKPTPTPIIATTINRPELQLYDAQLNQLDAQKQVVKSSVRPRFGAFAQGFYGNPGLNLFDDMVYGHWSWNYIAGVRIQWNFGGYYTKRNNLRKIEIAQSQSNNRRELFLFNTSVQTTQQQTAINKMQRVMADDEQIIALRRSIRMSSEAKLANGVINTTDLVRDITAENQASIEKSSHEIELLRAIYDLKNTINE